MRKILRQALDIISANQYLDGIWCIGCKNGGGKHHAGCKVESIFKHAKEHGLHYD